MTLLFTDGCDVGDFANKYEAVNASVGVSATTRFGVGQSLLGGSVGGGSIELRKSVTASTKLVVGYAYRHAGTTDTSTLLAFYGDAGATLHMGMRFLTTGAVAIVRGTTVVATSATGIVNNSNGWQYVEFSCLLSDTVGTAEVKINGTTAVTFSGDTKNAGTATTLDTVMWIFPGVTNANPYWDDIYILNSLGSVNNDFLGDIRIQTLVPNGVGSIDDLTPVGSANNWENVDEIPISAADYNYSNTAGHKDLYAMGELLAGTTAVLGVVPHVVARKTDSGSRSVKTLIKHGSTQAAGSTVALSTTQDTFSTIHETNPDTGVAWTVADIATLEAGVEVV